MANRPSYIAAAGVFVFCLFVLSLWLNAHAGLALVVDLATGEKGCVDMLARFVGLAEGDWRFPFVKAVSLLWIPIAAAVGVLLIVVAVRRSCRFGANL